MAQVIAIAAFGSANYLADEKPYNYIMFVVLFLCRFIQGFGKGCIYTSGLSIIAFNFPNNMTKLLGIQNLCT